MTCQEVADYLADYLSGELPDHEHARFEEHLRLCPNCVEYLAIYRTTVTLGRDAFGAIEAEGRSVPEALVAAILAARRSEPAV